MASPLRSADCLTVWPCGPVEVPHFRSGNRQNFEDMTILGDKEAAYERSTPSTYMGNQFLSGISHDGK
jgi:hypothetical protein